MGPMQVDLVDEEPLTPKIFALEEGEGREVPPVPEVKKASIEGDFIDEEAFSGLERLVKFLERKKKREKKGHQSKEYLRILAYEKALYSDEEHEVLGMRLNKAG